MLIFFSNKAGREEFQRNPVVILELLGIVAIPAIFQLSSVFLKLKKIAQGKIPVEAVKGIISVSFLELKSPYLDIISGLGSLIGVDPVLRYAVKIGEHTIHTTKESVEASEDGKMYTIYFIR